VRPTLDGYYDRVDALYAGLRELCPQLRQRSDSGEDVEALAMETWKLFRSIS